MLQQLAEYDIFWTQDGLQTIANGNDFDQNIVDNIYIAYLHSVNDTLAQQVPTTAPTTTEG
jgi:hypothetical protein